MIKILNKINNFFYYSVEKVSVIEDGELKVKGKYFDSMYIELVGSVANDGFYRIESVTDGGLILDTQLVDEVFDGKMYLMKVPNELEELKVQIEEYEKKNVKTSLSSESFGNYSRSISTNKEGNNATWFDVFREELMPYKRIVSKQVQRGGVKIVK